jgi:hypothetical protein
MKPSGNFIVQQRYHRRNMNQKHIFDQCFEKKFCWFNPFFLFLHFNFKKIFQSIVNQQIKN